MELKLPSPEQAYWGLRAMKTVAMADGASMRPSVTCWNPSSGSSARHMISSSLLLSRRWS